MTDLITAPSSTNKLRAKFFKDDGGRDHVEISIIGDPNTLIAKVTPEHVHRFAADWESYSRGLGEVEVAGTPLTDVPGIDRNVSLAFRLKGVRTAEELANLDESAAKSLGMGGLTFWNAANNLVKLRHLEALQAAAEAQPRRGRPPKIDTQPEMAEA